MSEQTKVTQIKGTVTLADGSTSEFSIGEDFGVSQWGADIMRLGETVDVMEALVDGLRNGEGLAFVMASASDEEDEKDLDLDVDAEEMDPDLEDEPTYKIVRFYGPGDERPNEVMQTDLTLAEAQAHCQSPTSKGDGWFDGYYEEG